MAVLLSSSCPYCRQALASLTSAGVAHEVLSVDEAEGRGLRAAAAKSTSKTSVPSVWVRADNGLPRGLDNGARAGNWIYVGVQRRPAALARGDRAGSKRPTKENYQRGRGAVKSDVGRVEGVGVGGAFCAGKKVIQQI